MDKIPNRIFLQIHGDAEVENINEVSDIDEGNVTWCKDKIYPTDVEYVRAKSPWIRVGDRNNPMPNDKPCILLLEDGTIVDDRSDFESKNMLVLAWMPIPSFDDILTKNDME